MEISFWAKTILIIGIVLVGIGLVMIFLPKVTIFYRLGRLSGDIVVRKGNVTFYFPWVTCVLLSVILTLLLALFRR